MSYIAFASRDPPEDHIIYVGHAVRLGCHGTPLTPRSLTFYYLGRVPWIENDACTSASVVKRKQNISVNYNCNYN